MHLNRKLIGGGAFVAVIATLGLVPGAPGAGRTVRPDVSPSLRHDFGVFRHTYPVRRSYAAALATALFGGAQTASNTARETIEVAHPGSTTKILLLPRGDQVCLSEEAGGLSCMGAEKVEAGALSKAHYCADRLAPGKVRYYGLLPDGARDPVLITAQGRAELSLVDNVYAVETSARPVRLQWADAGGVKTMPTPAPDPSAMRCAPPGGDPADKDSSAD